jgi:hypothetical protein
VEELSSQSIRKITLWETANEELEKWNDPDLPPYIPSPAQWEPHLDEGRFVEVAGGEGGGKTRLTSQEMFGRSVAPALYWLGGKQYENTHIEFSNLVKLFIAVGAIEEGELKMRVSDPKKEAWELRPGGQFQGLVIRTRSIEDVSKIASWSLNGGVMCEAALCSEEAFRKMAGRVRRGRNGWLWLVGTFEKQEGPWYANLYNQWQVKGAMGRSYSLPTESNIVSYPGGAENPEIIAMREENTEERFLERYMGIPVPPSTLVFKQFKSDVHMGDFGFIKYFNDKDSDGKSVKWPVELAIDPGYANYAILAIQRDKDAYGEPIIRVIGEIFGHNAVTEQMIEECQRKPWWPNLQLGNPGVIDIAAKQHHGDRSVMQVWRENNIQLRARRVALEDGIYRLSTFLEDYGRKTMKTKDGIRMYPNPQDWARVLIDASCVNLQKEFANYQYREDEPSERRIPIDAFNHGLKALSYYLIDRFGYGRKKHATTRDFSFA